jgi:hypothetical protein
LGQVKTSHLPNSPRIYLLSSIASLLFVLGSELTRRRRVQQVATERAFKTGEGGRSESYVAGSPNTDYQAGHFEKVEPTIAAIGEVASCTTTQAGTRKGVECSTARSGSLKCKVI